MPQYECDCCGACCRGQLIVEAYELDLFREPRLATADRRTVNLPLDAVMADLDQDGHCLVIACGKACHFLGQDNLCTIYPTRPNVCVAMRAGDEQCQRARAVDGLPPLPPVSE